MAIATASPSNLLVIRDPDPIGRPIGTPRPSVIKKCPAISSNPNLGQSSDLNTSDSSSTSSLSLSSSTTSSSSSNSIHPQPKPQASSPSTLPQGFVLGVSDNSLVCSSRNLASPSENLHPISSSKLSELTPRSLSPMTIFSRLESSSPTSALENFSRARSETHSGRHRRKSSVSISPPFSRSPSPTLTSNLSPAYDAPVFSRPVCSSNLPLYSIQNIGFQTSSASSPSSFPSSSSSLSTPSDSDEDISLRPYHSQNSDLPSVNLISDLEGTEIESISENCFSTPLSVNDCSKENGSHTIQSSPIEDASGRLSSASPMAPNTVCASPLPITGSSNICRVDESSNIGHSSSAVSTLSIPLLKRSRARSRSTTQAARPSQLELSSGRSDDLSANNHLDSNYYASTHSKNPFCISRSQSGSKRVAPAPLDLALSNYENAPNGFKCSSTPAGTEEAAGSLLNPSDGQAFDHQIEKPLSVQKDLQADCSSSGSNFSDINSSGNVGNVINHIIIKPEDDLIIEDEERKAAEWMGCKTNEASDGWSQECLMDDQSQFYDPLMLMANSEAEAEDNGLSTMEKIFLFAKSGNSYHRVIVSQRLPDLLEDVDITEAVEYVLPLLSGLASDEESVQEALAPSLCNIMWYYFSKCHLSQINFNHQNSSQDFLLAERECTEIDWQPTSRRKRPEISVGSFMAPIVTLLAESNRSVSLLTRFGLLVLLCRLTDRPFPSCSGEVISISSEPFFPVEERSKEEDQIYEEYGFEEPVRRSIALELAEAIVYELCRLNQVCQIQMRDGPSESESEEWDTVPLVGEEIELELPNQSGPKGCTNQMDAAIFFDESSELEFSSLDCDSFLLHSSRRRNYNCVLDEPMDMSNEPQNIRRHIGLTLIESFIQTDCFGSDFKNFKLLPVITRVMPGEDSRAVRQQAASSLSAFMEAFLTSSQSSSDRMWCTNSAAEVRKAVIECYSKFAADPDYEVRRQICLCLPSMVRIVWGRAAEKITLHYLDYFSKDETQEVRIICCQTLGELIYLFHEKRCTVPPKLAGYFIHGFGERPYKESCSGRATYEQLRSIGKSMDLASSLIRNYEGFGMSNGPGAYQSILPTPSCSANLHSKEQIEMAMCCAYNFPAVFLTLGVDRWHDLRDLFLKLATDVSFPNKIRKSLACSIHEFLTVIKAEKDKSHQNGLRECHLLKNQKLALEDCLKVLRFFLFNEDALMIESVFENFDRSFENLLVIGEEHLEWVEILKGLNDYFDEESTVALKKVNWRVREQVVLTLPRLLHKLGEFIRSSENSAQKALLEGLKLFETLLFSGLRDCTAAVREAGLKFLPILFEFQRPDLDESRIRILQRLRKMSQDSNYRIRANLPGALLSLVKLPMSVELFESIVLDEKLANICNDRVGGVRIGLSRLVNEICSSKNFYSIESGRRVPLLVQKIMEELSLDCEMVVRSYVDGLSINRGEECNEEPEFIERCLSNEEEREAMMVVNYGTKSSHLTRSFEGVIASGPNTSVGLAEDEEEDDLSGSGIQVFGIRLSEDEGEEVSLGEEIYNTESEVSQSPAVEKSTATVHLLEPSSTSLRFDDISKTDPCYLSSMPAQNHDAEPVEEQLTQRLGGYELGEPTEEEHDEPLGGQLPFMATARRPDPRRRGTTENYKLDKGITDEACLQSKKRAVSSPSAVNSLWPFSAPATTIPQDAMNPTLTGTYSLLAKEDYELTFSHTTNGNNHSSISNQPNRKLLTFNARTGSSPSRKGNRRSISHNQVIGGYDGSVMMGGGAGKRRGNGSSSNGRGIDTLWMRDTDGGFVEVGEY